MIEVQDLVFSYPGAPRPAVEGLGFSVREGEVFGFLGPSGAGKSTTQKVLAGLLRDYRGRVELLGRDLRGWGSDLYERVGVGFEVPNLYLKLSALENLASFRALYSVPTAEPAALLERVGLSGDADVRVSQFSKGMKVRLGFVRALLNQPRLLFLDEPTAGLDPVNAGVVKQMIRERRDSGVTVFLTTHDMTVADELCNRVAFLVDGEMRCVDAPRSLKLRYGRRRVRVEYRVDGALESRDFDLEGLASNGEFLDTLRAHRVETIHSQETSLERVFIELTGRGLT